MSKIIAIHSFRRGAGKSSLAANLAILLAQKGLRIGLMDTDLQMPGLHLFFGIEADSTPSVNDAWFHNADIRTALCNLTARLPAMNGQLWLAPASTHLRDLNQALTSPVEAQRASASIEDLLEHLKLDLLLLDVSAGLNENSLTFLSLADQLLLLLRADQQDYQGTAVTLDVAGRLEIPSVLLVVNLLGGSYAPLEAGREAERAYGCEVAAVLPYVEELTVLGSSGLFVLQNSHHPLTQSLRQLADRLSA